MLQSIRTATQNWIGYGILVILTVFLVGAFALWGVGDIFRGGVDTTVATIGSRTVDRETFDRELKNQIRAFGAAQNQELTMEQARALGLDKVILDRMIDRIAIDERVDDLGLTASEETIRARIQSDRAFQGADGRFEKGRFIQILTDASISESEYVEGMRGDIARQQYVVAAIAGVQAPPRLARLLYDHFSEQRVAEYIVVRLEDAGRVPEPTEAELIAFHKAQTAAFSTPEYREIEFIQIGVNEVASDIPLSEEAIKQSWERRKGEFQKPELREVEQITFPNQAAAAAAHARIQSGTPFLTVAREAGKTDADVKLGTFEKARLDPRIAGAAFALSEGGVSAPIQGPFAWTIVRVVKITPGETKTFEQMRDKIRTDLLKERAAERIADVSNKFEDARGDDKPFAEAAKIAGLTAQRLTIDAKGQLPDGAKAPIPAAPVFLQQTFGSEVGSDGSVFSDDDGTMYAINVIGVRPPALRPLASVRAQVRERWVADRQAKLLLARVQALTAQAQREKSLAGAAAGLGRGLTTSPALNRRSAGDVFSADALNKLFSNPAGTAIYARVGKGNGYVIARATKVTHPPPPMAAVLAMRNQVSEQLARDVGDTVAMAARKEAGVEINQQAVRTVVGETPQ